MSPALWSWTLRITTEVSKLEVHFINVCACAHVHTCVRLVWLRSAVCFQLLLFIELITKLRPLHMLGKFAKTEPCPQLCTYLSTYVCMCVL